VGLLNDLTSPPKERYAVSNDNVVQLNQPGTFQDQLTEVLRRGAPILYLKGISTGDFSEALAALLGKDASGDSAMSQIEVLMGGT
jgi:hypothetical protein